MADEPLAVVPDKPVRVKITNPDGSWAKATVTRIPHESELAEGESIEVLDDESGLDAYGQVLATEYGEAPKAKKAAASKEEVK